MLRINYYFDNDIEETGTSDAIARIRGRTGASVTTRGKTGTTRGRTGTSVTTTQGKTTEDSVTTVGKAGADVTNNSAIDSEGVNV